MERLITTTRWVLGGIAGAGTLLAAHAPAVHPPLTYETSAYELAPHLTPDPVAWSLADVSQELLRRAAREKQRRELTVDYYRIGHVLSFQLPISHRPTAVDFPPGIASMTYPWMIWLSWELEDRWRVAYVAWRKYGDRDAGELLQRELAALATWDHFFETRNVPGLATAHIAACLAQALSRKDGWDAERLEAANTAAAALVERDVWPWFEKTWSGNQPHTARSLVNIPVITLARGAQLARVIGSPRAAALEAKTIEVLRTWMRSRTGADYHTEGTAYDGYLMDSLTEWLAALPQRADLRREGRDAFRSLADEWIELTLPGRFDLHAPIGDVEPEMTYWTAPLIRLARWNDWTDAAWLLRRVPLHRLPAATLVETLDATLVIDRATGVPAIAPRAHPHAATLRSGWSSNDMMAVVSAPRNPMGHLHNDAGHLVLGWRGRFWITDPGYQQYRPGDERIYTVGPQAHNAPVIGGAAQKRHAAGNVAVRQLQPDLQHATMDLTACYEKLPAAARVQREAWFASGNGSGVVVRDRFDALAPNVEIGTHWLGGTHLAWAFVDGWARLSDGRQALWIGTPGERIAPAALTRDVGSRGPLTLTHRTQLAEGSGERWWVLWCDRSGGWTPPSVSVTSEGLRVEGHDGTSRARTFGK